MAGCYTEQHGLTLPELVAGLVVVCTLAFAAFHQLPGIVQENRMVAEVNAFVAALHLARNEAVKHAARVVLCPARDGRKCGSSKDWDSGWMLFRSDDRERDVNEPLLQSGNPMQSGITLRSGNHRKRVVYRQDGSSGGTNTSFTFCDRRGLAKPRVICLSNTGRPRLTMTRCDGKPIECT